jgi:hypothetical protein
MDTVIFNNNEDAYKKWLNDNPEGYVVNLLEKAKGTASKSDINSTCLHHVNCFAINPLVSDKEKLDLQQASIKKYVLYQRVCL